MRGVILDTSVLIASERSRESIPEFVERLESRIGPALLAISTVVLIELAHGLARAKTDSARALREDFLRQIMDTFEAVPLSIEIALLAGRIDGELAARGLPIEYEDLVIGVSALHLGYGVATGNVRHFIRIPGLQVLPF